MKVWNNYPEDYVEAELQRIKERIIHYNLAFITTQEILITLDLINISVDERRCLETQCKKLGWKFEFVTDLPTIIIPVALIKQYKSECKKLELEKDFTND